MTVLPARGQSLIVDMSALDFMDCSSLSVLLRVARQAGGDVVLAAPQQQARRLLALNGQDDAFCVHASVRAAVASNGPPAGSRYAERRPAVSIACPGGTAPLRTDTR
jgi:anti-anti-sigma regulatory factor